MTEEMNPALWPGWETVRLIGRGSYGAVYEIERDLLGEKEKAALKVIVLPKNDSDIQEMYSEGYDEESITNTFRDYLKRIVEEYTLMRKLNGSANVVNCDDVRYIQHDDGIGWDILIKMELLTQLTTSLARDVPESQVVKLGMDISSALVLCKKENIIHRDIKPQNIFVSPHGVYKLGDFGIAKTMEKTSSGTKAGTYKYMAPEVYNNQPYGHTADVYSLGIVLYWMLNERRVPFLPLPPVKIDADLEDEAKRRRFRGEPIPPPAHGSPELKRIVLKALAYDPKARYQSAAELLADLTTLRSEPLPDPQKMLLSAEKTTGLFSKQSKDEEDPTSQLFPRRVVPPVPSESPSPPAPVKPPARSDPLPPEESASKPPEAPASFVSSENKLGSDKPSGKKHTPWFIFAIPALLLVLLAVGVVNLIGGGQSGADTAPQSTEASVLEEAAHVHEWGAWVTENSATCEEPGTEVRVCKLDTTHQETREISALGHDWIEATTEFPSTCSRCGAQIGSPLATPAPVPEFQIKASAGAGGTISPSGNLRYADGTSCSFTVAANPGYVIDAVYVDGVEQDRSGTYSLTLSGADMTIQAEFRVAKHRYEARKANMTWSEAEEFCETLGGHLATISSEAELNRVLGLAEGLNLRAVLLGGTVDWSNPAYTASWVTGEDFVYSTWYSGEPNNKNNFNVPENYIALLKTQYGDWGMFDVPENPGDFYSLSSSIGFIIEWEE